MTFATTDAQRAIAESVGAFVRQRYEFHRRRRRAPASRSEALENWREFAELGWLGIGLGEQHGGLGLGAREMAVVAAEFGAGLVPEPWLESAVFAARLLEQAADGRHGELLQASIAGESTLAVAHGERTGHHALDGLRTTARLAGDAYVLTGHKSCVGHGSHADWLIVSARSDHDGVGLFLVGHGAPGLRVTEYATIDLRTAADVQLDAVRVPRTQRLEGGAAPLAALRDCLCTAAVVAAAESASIAAALVRATAQYLGERKQFGVPLASFQALQHRVADMYMDAEEACALTALALDALERLAPAEAADLVADVKQRVDRLCVAVGHAAIQLHGGMGFSDELIVSHCARRMQALSRGFALPQRDVALVTGTG